MIEVSGLTKKYGSNTVVDNLSFTIGENCVFGFLGPNGAGKSTTMNMITGCLAPTEGTIKINGCDMSEDREKARQFIGYLPEIPPVYEELTPFEYLMFVGEAKKIPKKDIKDNVYNVMEKTGIKKMENRLIKNLSKGYRQRVGIAQAILGNPQIVILDEPTVGLDPEQIIEIRDLIKDIGKTATVIISSHILTEISAVCDNILIISQGKLVANDTTENLVGTKDGQKHIAMEIMGEKDNILAAISNIEGIIKIMPVSENAGITNIEIIFDEALDPRAAIFNALSKENMPIISSYIKKNTLEEIFLDIVQKSFTSELTENAVKGGEEK